jgi:hypothetical protein
VPAMLFLPGDDGTGKSRIDIIERYCVWQNGLDTSFHYLFFKEKSRLA